MKRKVLFRYLSTRLENYLLVTGATPASQEELEGLLKMQSLYQEHIADPNAITALVMEKDELTLYFIQGRRSQTTLSVLFMRFTEEHTEVIDVFSFAEDGLGIRVFVENKNDYADDPRYYHTDIESHLSKWSGATRKKHR